MKGFISGTVRYILALFLLQGVYLHAQPSNNNPCGAIPLEAGDACSFRTFSTVGATRSSVQNPSCGNYAGSNDVWFVTMVPASGTLEISTQAGTLNDMSMSIYSAPSCEGPFTEIACATEGSVNPLMPRISRTGLTPGSYIFIRVWDRVCTTFLICGLTPDPYQEGTFGICVRENYAVVNSGNNNTGSYDCASTPPAGNTCEEATTICTFNGYCGSTQGYTANFWFDGPRGLGGPLTANGIFCGSIENNSFVRFIAGTTSITLQVIVSGSSTACADGVQFMMFGNPTGGQVCQSLDIVSYGCLSPMPRGNNTFTASGLTIGQEYYLMVDGFAGDRCSYQINAVSGVLIGISAGEDRTICLGDEVTLSVFGAAPGQINWSGPGLINNTGQTVKAKPTATGSFQYIVDAPNPGQECGGPPRSRDTVLVNVLPPLQDFEVRQSGGCDGNGVTLTATGAQNYTWQPSTGLSRTTGSTVVANPAVTTTYTVTASNGAGCFATKTVTVAPGGVPALSVNAVSDSICAGGNGTQLIASSGFETYTWSPATGLNTTTGSTVVANPQQPGTYTYTVTGTITDCPNSTAQVTITVLPSSNIEVTPSNSTICQGQSVTLSASPQGAYNWTGPGGFSQQGAGSITFTPSESGTYTATSAGFSCLQPGSATVIVTPIPSAPTGVNGSRCSPGPVLLSVSSQCIGTVNWYTVPEGGQPVGTGITFTTPSISENTSYYASCSVNGCEGPRAEVIAEFENNPPDVTAVSEAEIICEEGQVQLTSSSSASDVSFQWQGPGIVSGGNTATPIVNRGGQYTVTVVNDCGTASAIVQVTEDPECDCDVFIPNAFSPNGDGRNDRLVLKQDGIKESKLIIYSRWGEKVFETTDLNETWDGTFKGRMAQSDVFGYYYEGTCLNGEKVILQGNITVVK